jgi:hypothetical protein
VETPSSSNSILDDWLIKVTAIMPRLIYVQVGSVVVLTMLRWVTLQSETLEMRSGLWTELVGLMAPLSLVAFLVPITDILKKNAAGFFFLLAWAAASTPVIFSQLYLEDRTGELVSVDSIGDLRDRPLSRFYRIRNFDADTTRIAVYEDIKKKKNGGYLVSNFFVVPGTDPGSDVDTTSDVIYWFGKVIYHGTRDFSASDLEKFKRFDFHRANYFTRMHPSVERDGFLNAIESASPALIKKSVILDYTDDPFEERGGDKLEWIWNSALIGDIVIVILLLLPEIKTKEDEILESEDGH